MVQHLTTLATMSEHSGPKPQDRPLVWALAWRGLPPLNGVFTLPRYVRTLAAMMSVFAQPQKEDGIRATKPKSPPYALMTVRVYPTTSPRPFGGRGAGGEGGSNRCWFSRSTSTMACPHP